MILRDGMQSMDFDRVTAMLSHAFWCPGIQKEEVMRAASHSALVVGAFSVSGVEQVSYARVISDKTRFAYIADVYVDENFRGQGIGKSMIRYVLSHPELREVYQWLLITKDAQGLYQQCGFTPLSRTADWMEIRRPRPDRSGTAAFESDRS